MSKVADVSKEVQHMLSASERGVTLMKGADAMRQAGKKYLPKFEAESDLGYKARLDASWLFNAYRATVKDMKGRVFDKPITLGKDVPQSIVEMCDNVDLQGNDLSRFAGRVFEDALKGAGVSYIMVDAPPRDRDVSIAEAREQNLRPYMVHLSVNDVLGWKTHVVGNVTKLSMLRIKETVKEDDKDDEFSQDEIEQVRVLDLAEGRVRVRLYRSNDKKEMALVDEYLTQMTEIQVAPVYLNRTGFMTGEPPLDDLADANIAHWQSQSDQRNILHTARVPMLFGAGFQEEDTMVLGANSAIKNPDPSAKLGWVEHSGQAIGAGRQDILDIEEKMRTYGLQLLVSKANQSATGAALDAQKETSQLSDMADALKDALEQALIWFAAMTSTPIPDSDSVVEVNKEFTQITLTAQDVSAMLAAVNSGQMSTRTFLSELVRGGFVTPDLNIEAEIEQIEAEGGDVGDDDE